MEKVGGEYTTSSGAGAPPCSDDGSDDGSVSPRTVTSPLTAGNACRCNRAGKIRNHSFHLFFFSSPFFVLFAIGATSVIHPASVDAEDHQREDRQHRRQGKVPSPEVEARTADGICNDHAECGGSKDVANVSRKSMQLGTGQLRDKKRRQDNEDATEADPTDERSSANANRRRTGSNHYHPGRPNQDRDDACEDLAADAKSESCSQRGNEHFGSLVGAAQRFDTPLSLFDTLPSFDTPCRAFVPPCLRFVPVIVSTPCHVFHPCSCFHPLACFQPQAMFCIPQGAVCIPFRGHFFVLFGRKENFKSKLLSQS